MVWLIFICSLTGPGCVYYTPSLDDDLESWTVTTPLGPPAKYLFKRRWTKLTIDVSTKPGDEETHENLKQFVQTLQAQNSRDRSTKKTRKGKRRECHFVTDEHRIPRRFHFLAHFFFTIFGLSLPYSWFLYFSIGHVNYRIDKKLFSSKEDDISQTTQVNGDLSTDSDDFKSNTDEEKNKNDSDSDEPLIVID